jgi:hypothetical protein
MTIKVPNVPKKLITDVGELEREFTKSLVKAHEHALDVKSKQEQKQEEEELRWAYTILATVPEEVEKAAKTFETKAMLMDVTSVTDMYTWEQGARDAAHPIPRKGLKKLIDLGNQMEHFRFYLYREEYDDYDNVKLYVTWDKHPCLCNKRPQTEEVSM